jgi:integrase
VRGSVVKKKNRWYVVIERPRDPVTGRRRQEWHSGFLKKREADDKLQELLGQNQAGTYVDHPRQAVAEFMADWFPAIERTVRPATFESYQRNVRLHVLPAVGAVKPAEAVAALVFGADG